MNASTTNKITTLNDSVVKLNTSLAGINYQGLQSNITSLNTSFAWNVSAGTIFQRELAKVLILNGTVKVNSSISVGNSTNTISMSIYNNKAVINTTRNDLYITSDTGNLIFCIGGC